LYEKAFTGEGQVKVIQANSVLILLLITFLYFMHLIWQSYHFFM